MHLSTYPHSFQGPTLSQLTPQTWFSQIAETQKSTLLKFCYSYGSVAGLILTFIQSQVANEWFICLFISCFTLRC